jgi:hypothetical protein
VVGEGAHAFLTSMLAWLLSRQLCMWAGLHGAGGGIASSLAASTAGASGSARAVRLLRLPQDAPSPSASPAACRRPRRPVPLPTMRWLASAVRPLDPAVFLMAATGGRVVHSVHWQRPPFPDYCFTPQAWPPPSSHRRLPLQA